MRGFEILLMVQKTGKCHWFSECCFSVLGTMESFPLSSYYIEGLFFSFVCWFTRTNVLATCLVHR